MNLRAIVKEIRDFPATALFGASWLLVFAAMVALRLQEHPAPTIWQVLVAGFGDGGRFGDLTLNDLAAGEYWRLITCNFVHYSVVHIGMNLFAFYLLGTLLESWYGSWALVTIYGMTGVGGNLLSAMAREAMGSSPAVHSGGGSVVIMGLIGLCATAGWASRAEGDRELTWQMLKALAITGALGLAFPRYIDNWGHAGGAIVGLPIGLAHRRLFAGRGGPRAWAVGVAWLLVIAAGVAAQARSDFREAGARELETMRSQVRADAAAYRALLAVRSWATRGVGNPKALAPALRSLAPTLDGGPTRSAYRRLLAGASEYARRKPTPQERAAFRADLETVMEAVREEASGRLREYWSLRRR
ncbi:rhomboid family intramembrane serine protease [Paludisphaera sp.]|uniref:rhomboid family intramembrane serine protease n=1 Tax=Paludisphaera sp. TaxID=2017432 RepID=UPI00301D118F